VIIATQSRKRNRVYTRTPSEERFWRFVAPIMDDRGCWEWVGTLKPNGYGLFSFHGGGRANAHRYSWVLHFGPIPDGLYVCHRCDNPSCVRPEHLFLGTARDNMQDASRKGRIQHLHGERSGSHKLTSAAVVDIRARVASGEMQKTLADEYGVAHNTVSNIMSRRRWSHI
jgi:hypothetical protein